MISTQTIYVNQKLHTLNRVENDFKFVQFFFYTPCIVRLFMYSALNIQMHLLMR